MATARKLKEVGQSLDSMTTREDFTHFLNDPGNVQTLNGLVEDIYYILMDYQVCSPQNLTFIFLMSTSDFNAAGYLHKELSADCGSYSLTV